MSLDLKDYAIICASGFGTTVILEGLFYVVGFFPTTVKKTITHGLVNGLSLTAVFGAIDNVKPIKKEVQKELFPHMRDDDCNKHDDCSF